MTDFQNEKKSAADFGSAQEFTSTNNTNGDRTMKEDAAKNQSRTPLKGDVSALKTYLNSGYELMKLNGKKPAERGWQKAESLTLDDAAYCFELGKNVGVRLSEKDLVIDVDPRNFPEGVDEFARFIDEFSVDESAVVETGSGGKHIYLEKPSSLKVSGKLAGYSGIDIKTAGGFVVAAGSLHPETGDLYRWKSDALCLVEDAPPKLLKVLSKKSASNSVAESGEVSCEQLEEMLSALDPCDFKDQTEWLNLMMACHHATGGLGKSEFIAWSVSDSEYAEDAETIEKRWNSLKADKPSCRTVASLYRELFKVDRGDLVPKSSAVDDFKDDILLSSLKLDSDKSGNVKSTFPNACEILRHDCLKPARNEFSVQSHFTGDDLPWPDRAGREVDDDMIRLTRSYLFKQYGLCFSSRDVFEAVESVALEHPFNPVLDYLDQLSWDGVPRLSNLFVDYFGAEDSDYVRALSRIFMIAMTRRARQPGCKFDQLFCLEGKQGTGKSTALSIIGGDYFSDAAFGSLVDKDTVVLLKGKWLVEWSEGVSVRKSRNDELKSFLSRTHDECRMPYGIHSKKLPRRFIIVSTTNDSAYLGDMTGSRRMWPITTNEIDLDRLKRDRDQLFAEACVAERKNESIVLPKELWSTAAEQQEKRLAEDPWCDTIRDYLADFDEPRKISSRELLETALKLEGGRQAQTSSKRLRSVMERLGYEHKSAIRFGKVVLGGYILL